MKQQKRKKKQEVYHYHRYLLEFNKQATFYLFAQGLSWQSVFSKIGGHIEMCKLDFFKGGFDILKLDNVCYYNIFLWFCSAHEKWILSEFAKTFKNASKTKLLELSSKLSFPEKLKIIKRFDQKRQKKSELVTYIWSDRGHTVRISYKVIVVPKNI